jgi:DNA-directed RNA polymerase subunit beta
MVLTHPHGAQATSPLPAASPDRRAFGHIPEVMVMPHLAQVQRDSFDWFLTVGLRELLDEISPIRDFTGQALELSFGELRFGPPRHDPDHCRRRALTYSAPLQVRTRLLARPTGEVREAEVFMGEFPLMTDTGTFIINGVERVVVSQLVRAPGVYFTATEAASSGRKLFAAKVIPNRGAWLEFDTTARDVITVRFDRARKFPATILLRALGYATDEQLAALFGADPPSGRDYLRATLDKDPTHTREEALIELYKRLRPGEPPTPDNAATLLTTLLFTPRRYDLARVGRYKLNGRLDLDEPLTTRVLTPRDVATIVATLVRLNHAQARPDDIDHLGNRRVRSVGELLANQVRIGLLRMERVIRERMSLQDAESVTPASLINTRPVTAALREFFGGSPFSQFMDQTNPLAELTQKRRLSAMGPGGLHKDRASLAVRDVHNSHYGRLCPIETQEGPTIGLVGALATHARINDFGFIETPYRRVRHTVANRPDLLTGRLLREPVIDPATGAALAPAHTRVTPELAAQIARLGERPIAIAPYVSDQIEYLTADVEDRYGIVQANAPLDAHGEFVGDRVAVRHQQEFRRAPVAQVDYMDVSPKQVVSLAAALIPFLEHDDANRALMGANMQRQAVPLLQPEAPIVGTGMEARAARDSGRVVLSRADGTVVGVEATCITVQADAGGTRHIYPLPKFVRSNQDACINARPGVVVGQRVRAGDVLADGAATAHGELALGRNILVAFMSWEGGNFEDAILISERLVREDVFTSIHIESYEVAARDTKLGPEEITRDIPNVGEESLKDLDERGIVFVGAEVTANDILVGKITPKGETELSAEERLLRAIFGEKAREVKDTSLRVPHGVRGKVIDVTVFSRENGDDLAAGVGMSVRVLIAQKRKIGVGDKMAGRHGNKGVISRVLPVEDMPFLPDGTPVDIILNPLGVPHRMNIGQLFETHLGWAAQRLGYRVATPVFDGATEEAIRAELHRAALPSDGKVVLYDGRTGEPFDNPVTVGQIYMLKLAHLVEDKVHARSTGPYSLVTQQPLSGKSHFGGQRFGEMEVWALEAYGAAHTLQEMWTVKSDDTLGRVRAYEAIVKGEAVGAPGVPESFKVLVRELQSLGLNIEVLDDAGQVVPLADDALDTGIDLDLNLAGFEPEGGGG